jgi:ribosomal protein S18 acetylase RimI-like enzyme
MAENKIFIIRKMRPDDISQAFDLSLKEGWNQTLKDWRLLFDNPQNVCLVAEKDNMVAGTATALNHEDKIAWIGMVLVDKALRGQGAGKMLLEHIISSVKQIKSVKLDATPAGEPLYRKLGFLEEYKIFRMTCDNLNRISDMSPGKNLSSIDQDNLSHITEFDRVIFGADRSNLLMKLLTGNPGRAFFIRKNRTIEGFAFGRDGSRFNYLGPVAATSQVSAMQLICKSLESLNNQAIALDVPEDKADLIRWLESTGFVKQRHFVRMYLKDNPFPGSISNQYLISGPEFG